MSGKVNATVLVKGDADALQAYRKHVNELLAEEFQGEFRELHTEGRLEYAFSLRAGVPFPPFVMASEAFPEVTVEVEWQAAGERGMRRAVIQNGALREQRSEARSDDEASGASDAVLQSVRVDAGGRLQLAVACRRWRDTWHGYVAAADQHAFFRVEGEETDFVLLTSDGVDEDWAECWTGPADAMQYEELEHREPLDDDELRELDALARSFAEEWLWFAESAPEETAVERQRYETYGYTVAGANVRSEKLRTLLQPEGGPAAFVSFTDDAGQVVDLLERYWLVPDDREGR